MSDVLLVERDAGLVTVTLNRPEALNALSNELQTKLAHLFAELEVDPQVQTIILTGAGRAFSAGLDLKELGGEKTPMKADGVIGDNRIPRARSRIKVPVIAAINGFAITGGVELALMCDILIASTNAKFADTHARVGVVPGWGLSQRLPRIIGINRAKELSLSGNYLDAATAYEWGLVNRVGEPDALLPTAKNLARDIMSTDTGTRTEIKRIIDAGWEDTLAQGLQIEKHANERHSEKNVTTGKIASRRSSIQNRGRTQ